MFDTVKTSVEFSLAMTAVMVSPSSMISLNQTYMTNNHISLGDFKNFIREMKIPYLEIIIGETDIKGIQKILMKTEDFP